MGTLAHFSFDYELNRLRGYGRLSAAYFAIKLMRGGRVLWYPKLWMRWI